MLKAIKEFFFGKPKEVEAGPVITPAYDMTPPQPAKCGCGRSQSGFCEGLHKLTADEWAVHDSNPNKAQPVVEAKVDPVSVALDLEPVDLAAQPAEPAKKPRKPRAPKAEKPAKAPKAKAEKKPKEKKPAAMKAKKAK